MRKRVIICVDTIMTLISGIYYADQIKKRDSAVQTILIWRNATAYRIPVNSFKKYFNKIYIVPSDIWSYGIMSANYLKKKLQCYTYLFSSGLFACLNQEAANDVLMVGSDETILSKVVISVVKNNRNKSKVILFEEGMALYSEKKRTIRDIIEYNFHKGGDMQPVIGMSPYVDIIFAQRPQAIPDWKAHKRKVVQQGDVFCDIGIADNDNALRTFKNDLAHKKIILYLGQPINEFSDSFQLKEEITLMRKVVDMLPDDHVLLIKGHPRDSQYKYQMFRSDNKCKIFDNRIGWYPMECLLPLLDVKIVITFSSSAVLNILERSETCKAIYLYQYFGISIADTWDQMYRQVGERILIPTTKEEIQDFIFTEEKTYDIQENTSKKDVQMIMRCLR